MQLTFASTDGCILDLSMILTATFFLVALWIPSLTMPVKWIYKTFYKERVYGKRSSKTATSALNIKSRTVTHCCSVKKFSRKIFRTPKKWSRLRIHLEKLQNARVKIYQMILLSKFSQGLFQISTKAVLRTIANICVKKEYFWFEGFKSRKLLKRNLADLLFTFKKFSWNFWYPNLEQIKKSFFETHILHDKKGWR